jgi:hypothetical protein
MSAGLSDSYIQLTNDVLAVNYWGELLTVELLSGLLERDLSAERQALVARQLMDETRHANITRSFLQERGRDPIRDDSVLDFTYHRLFRDYAARSVEDVLTFLGSNERSSSRNFSALVKVGMAACDEALVALYSEILNDEVTHAHNIFASLPDTAEVKALADQAQTAMRSTFNRRYGKLVLAYPEIFGVKNKTAAGPVKRPAE